MASRGEDSTGREGDEGLRKRKESLSEEARRARAARRRERSGGRGCSETTLAIAHPLRRRMLRMLVDREEPLSPAQIAEELDQPVGTISYHARILLQFDALEPIRERQARGTIEQLYEATIASDPPIEALLEETREADDEGDDAGEDA